MTRYILLSLILILSASCTSLPDTHDISFEDVKVDNFFYDLDAYNGGCIIHSIISDGEDIPYNVIEAITKELSRFNKYKFQLIASNTYSSKLLMSKLVQRYNRYGIYNLDKVFVSKEYMIPPYRKLCNDVGKLYLMQMGIGISSRYTHKDEGITSILLITKKPNRNSYYSAPSATKEKVHRGRASEYFEKITN